jgi:hypothetical protein
LLSNEVQEGIMTSEKATDAVGSRDGTGGLGSRIDMQRAADTALGDAA